MWILMVALKSLTSTRWSRNQTKIFFVPVYPFSKTDVEVLRHFNESEIVRAKGGKNNRGYFEHLYSRMIEICHYGVLYIL